MVQSEKELEHVRSQLENYKHAFPTCDHHAPRGGFRSECVICSGMKLHWALSRISYVLGEPNEYEMSQYDVDYDVDKVVQQVEALVIACQELTKITEKIND